MLERLLDFLSIRFHLLRGDVSCRGDTLHVWPDVDDHVHRIGTETPGHTRKEGEGALSSIRAIPTQKATINKNETESSKGVCVNIEVWAGQQTAEKGGRIT